MNLGLKGKRVFISGSTQGIGLKTAEGFLDEGAKVMLNGRHRDRLESVVQTLLIKYPGKIFSSCTDLTSDIGIGKAMEDITQIFTGLDVYVANLGAGKPGSKDYLDVDDWKRFYQINILSNVALLDKLHPLLRKGENPNVVMISSIVAKEKAAAPYGYAAAKGAVLTFTKYLSKDWAQEGIRVNCVVPGNIYFDGGRWQELEKQDEKSVHRYITQEVPMHRFGHPEEIADAVLFLASSRASFITGTALTVDGGQLNCV